MFGLLGLLIGFGSRLGGGCTSGHGLCGLPRRSPRSLVAVLTFMTTGAITAFVTRSDGVLKSLIYNNHATAAIGDRVISYATPAAAVVLFSWALFSSKLAGGHRVLCGPSSPPTLVTHIITYLCALSFGIGLGISGMW